LRSWDLKVMVMGAGDEEFGREGGEVTDDGSGSGLGRGSIGEDRPRANHANRYVTQYAIRYAVRYASNESSALDVKWLPSRRVGLHGGGGLNRLHASIRTHRLRASLAQLEY
jgi:hypothetical protein